MSNYHVMSTSADGTQISVRMHIAVPNENNVAGVNVRTCLVEDTSIDKTSKVPWIDAAEQIQLTNGELIEKMFQFQTHPDIDPIVKRDAIDALFGVKTLEVQDELRKRYVYWHYNRNVP